MGFSNQDNSCQALGIGKLIKDNLLKGILLQNIRFREVYFEHLQTDDQLFLQECLLEFFFSKITPESWGCGLYTSVYGTYRK